MPDLIRPATQATSVRQATPTTPYPNPEVLIVDGTPGAEVRGLVDIDLLVPINRDARANSAFIDLHKAESFATGGLVTAEPLDEDFDQDTVTWDEQPDQRVPASSNNASAGGEIGDLFSIDITTMYNNSILADNAPGSEWLGVRLTTTAAAALKFFSLFADPEWVPKVRVSPTEPLEPPSELLPRGGKAVGKSKPHLIAHRAGSPDQLISHIQVQVDEHDGDFENPAFDTGERAATSPELNLALEAGFTALAPGDERDWRMNIKSDGQWSGWSEIAFFTYQPKPVVKITAPAAFVAPTFARASVAWGQESVAEVLANIPRYEPGPGKNVMTPNQSSLETDTTGWGVDSNCSIARSIDFSRDGVASLKLTATGGGNMSASTLAVFEAFPVNPGEIWTASAHFRPGSTVRNVRMSVSYFTVAGAYITTHGMAGQAETAASFEKRASLVVTVPATAAFANIQVVVDGCAAGEVHYVDEIAFTKGAVLYPWSLGGTSPFGLAMLLEEGTTNVLTANQSSLETDTTGWGVDSNCSIARSTSFARHGIASLRMTATAPGNMSASTPGALSGFAVAPGQLWTASACFRPGSTPRGVRMSVSYFTAAGAYITTHTNSQIPEQLGKFEARSVITVTIPATAAFANIQVVVDAAGAGEIHYVDMIQFANKAWVTTWQIGGTPRAADIHAIRTAGVFTKGSWTLEMQFNPSNTPSVEGVYLWMMQIDGSNFYRLLRSANGSIYLNVRSAGVDYSTANSSVLPGGVDNEIAIKGDGSNISLLVNGVRVGAAIAYTETTGVLPAWMYIGSNGGNDPASGRYDDPRVSSTPHSDAKIAADYATAKPLPLEDDTTWKSGFDGDYDNEQLAIIDSPTPDLAWTVTGGAQESFEVERLKRVGQVLVPDWLRPREVSAGLVAATPNEYPIDDDFDYRTLLKVWDTFDREDSPGDPSYVEVEVDYRLKPLVV